MIKGGGVSLLLKKVMPTNILRDASEVDPASPVSETVGK